MNGHKVGMIAWLGAAGLVAAGLGLGAEADRAARRLTAGETDGAVTYAYAPEGYVTMSFPAKRISAYSPPPYVAGMVVADGGAANSAFAGDYIAAEISELTFKIMSDGHAPATAQVVLQSSRSGRIWVNKNLTVSDQAGVWVTCRISFQRSAGWDRGGSGLDAKWDADIRSVGLIGIRITQGGAVAQAYSIDAFMLVSVDGSTLEGHLTPLERALRDRFGVTRVEDVSESDRAADTDGDGMTDLFEILATYDLDFANSIFTAEILSVTDEGVKIKWVCVEGWKYTVFRAARMDEGFYLLPGGVGVDIPALETGFMTFLDTTAAGDQGPYYYRILKRN